MKLPIWTGRPRSLLLAAMLLTATGCAGYMQPAPSDSVTWISVGPPPLRHEVRSQAPGGDHVWIAGYNRWNGASFDWVPGRWERRPEARARWTEGQWYHESRGWYYVEGHWDNRGDR